MVQYTVPYKLDDFNMVGSVLTSHYTALHNREFTRVWKVGF
jgi:hypothetical protein